MGGLGSGRPAYALTPTVEACRQLRVDDLTDLTASPGVLGIVEWDADGTPEASVALRVGSPDEGGRPPWFQLSYTVSDERTRAAREIAYRVGLEYTPCHFGGSRPWFRCPGVVDGEPCDRRVGSLYLPPGGDWFLCRHCHELGYTSSRTSGDPLVQAELRYRRAYAALDPEGRRPHPNDETVPPVPESPHGMHRTTYDDLVDDLDRARWAWEEAWMDWLRNRARSLEVR